MFDEQKVREMYEREVRTFGRTTITLGAYDRRVLIPRSAILDLVERKTGRRLTLDAIDGMSRDGLFTWLGGTGDDGVQMGVPLYVPDRIGLFARLEDRGWTRADLKDAAEWEEWVIDDCLADDDLAYEDDDVLVLARRVRSILREIVNELVARAGAEDGAVNHMDRSWNSVHASESTEELEQTRDQLASFLARLEVTELATARETWRHHVQREAYVTRHWQEFVRVMVIERDRRKLEAAFSPHISFSGLQALIPDPEDLSSFGSVDWWETLGSWRFLEDPDRYPIRLPGLVLVGGRITLEGVLSPEEYATRHALFKLEEYVGAFNEVVGDRRCAHCCKLLPRTAHERRRYCSDECSNAARQRRYRRNQKAEILRHRGPSAA